LETLWEHNGNNTYPKDPTLSPKKKKTGPLGACWTTEFQKDHEKSGHGLDLEWNILCHGVPSQGILAWARGPTP